LELEGGSNLNKAQLVKSIFYLIFLLHVEFLSNLMNKCSGTDRMAKEATLPSSDELGKNEIET
jgi:hypothetical protein